MAEEEQVHMELLTRWIAVARADDGALQRRSRPA
jgi:hypothetical protein